jgi:hypothetical protein
MGSLDISTASAVLKEAYADKIKSLLPKSAKLLKEVAFVSSKRQHGKTYNQPLIVRGSQAITVNRDGSAFSIQSPISMQVENAAIPAISSVLPVRIAYALLSRSQGVNAFERAADLALQDGIDSMSKRLEIQFLYGGDSLATTASSANASATTSNVTFTAASWAPGIWAGSEGTEVNFYRDDTGALVSSGADAIFTVTTVTNSTRVILITGTSTGITALDIAVAASACSIVFRGYRDVEMIGLKKQLTNTGTLFGINATTWGLFAGNTYSAASARLTVGKLQAAAAVAVQRGLEDDVEAFVSPATFANLSQDMASLRRFTSADRKAKLGADELEVYGPNGVITVRPHLYVKDGDSFMLPMDNVIRPGSSDITFSLMGSDKYFQVAVADTAAWEARLWSDQAIFLETPAQGVYLNAIVNS